MVYFAAVWGMARLAGVLDEYSARGLKEFSAGGSKEFSAAAALSLTGRMV
jgi:hypothetical protein